MGFAIGELIENELEQLIVRMRKQEPIFQSCRDTAVSCMLLVFL